MQIFIYLLYTRSMLEVVLIIGGVVAIVAFFFVTYALAEHPADVDEEATKMVAQETPAEHAEALSASHRPTSLEENEEDEKNYGPGL